MKQNILLESFDLPPFSLIKTEDFLPAIKHGISLAKQEVDAIVESPEPPTFENTVAALDYSGELLEKVSSVFFNLNSAETNEEIQKIAQKVSPLLSEFKNDIVLNTQLFERVKLIYEKKETLSLNSEQLTLLEKNYRAFSRNGAHLSSDNKESLRKIDKELSRLSLQFGENVLAETNKFKMLLTKEEELIGLPDHYIENAKAMAENEQKEGWLVTLDYPSYVPFMKYSAHRELRKKLYLAFGSKGFHQDDLDNQKLILDIVNLRYQKAQLLGYSSYAAYVLEERMAKSPENVITFLNDILNKAKPFAVKEFEKLQEIAKTLDNIDEIQKWDSAYYSEKLKQRLFQLDDELLKPYFKLEHVIAGVFKVSSKLFDISFKEVSDIDTYHDEVITYQVLDASGTPLAIFYADFHPRPGKRGGAWMTSYKSQMKKNGKDIRPQVSIVCNFTKPTPTQPSLLTFNEVTTLFHEFGHALHGILADTTYPGLSGTSVYWDFVELPSQILENWCYEREALELFATHYQTGALIPMELVQKIKDSATFMEGMATLRQLSFALLDMSWHSVDPSGIKDVKAHEKSVFSNLSFFPDTDETCMSTAFSHIFQGGYSAGYYSYKWAEVLDADAFEFFKMNGIFDKKIATLFKEHILSKGGTENPMELYKRFRGQEPTPEALLRRAGLLN